MPNKAPWEQKLMIKQQDLSSCQIVIRCTDKHKSPIEDGNSIYLVSVQVIFFYLLFLCFSRLLFLSVCLFDLSKRPHRPDIS